MIGKRVERKQKKLFTLFQADDANNEDNFVGFRLLALVHPDEQRAWPEGERRRLHLCQLSAGDTKLRAGETFFVESCSQKRVNYFQFEIRSQAEARQGSNASPCTFLFSPALEDTDQVGFTQLTITINGCSTMLL